MNILEFEYLNLKANQVQNEFANNDLTKLKTKEEIYKAYIAYLKKKIIEEKSKLTKTISYDLATCNRKEIINTEKNPTLKKAVKANVNISSLNQKNIRV